MRTEHDFLGKVTIPCNALYGIHSYRARENFSNRVPFPEEWYRATGIVKLANYRTIRKLKDAIQKEYPELKSYLKLPGKKILGAMESAATEIASGSHFNDFIVPAVQGGAGTSINMNINEIVTNAALVITGNKPGEYNIIDPIETANIFQSTNDVIPTALTVACMQLLTELEEAINRTRSSFEQLEAKYRNSLRLGYTQMQEAVPSTFGQLFSTYSEAMSRDWWRVSKAFERIKVVNLGGGATGTGISIPRYYIMEVVQVLKSITSLPVTQGENLPDATSNLDKWVEVHAILKAHAVNMEKIASDLRLLSSGVSGKKEISIPGRQVGSSIMPGKVNPVIPEYLVSSAHRIYANDQLITSLSALGCLELNAYLPEIGCALLDSLKLLISMNKSVNGQMLSGLVIHEERARQNLYKSPSLTTALTPVIGYHAASKLAHAMAENEYTIFEANETLALMERGKLELMMEPEYLLKQGFTMKDIRELL